MKALILNCTLKKSPGRSNSGLLAGEVISGLEERGVECETLRLVDLNVLPGVSSDEGDGDEWPGVREKILAADIAVMATPTWLGKISSVGMRVPLDGEVAWLPPEGSKPYWRGHINEISYEFAR